MRLYGSETGVNGYGRLGQTGMGAMGSGFRVLVHYQLQQSRIDGPDKLEKAGGAAIQVMTLNPLTGKMSQVGTTTAGPSGYASLILKQLPAGTPIMLMVEAAREWGDYAGETWVGGANTVTQESGEEQLLRIELTPPTDTTFTPGTIITEPVTSTKGRFPIIPVAAAAVLVAFLMLKK
jgi:hypothetical protein